MEVLLNFRKSYKRIGVSMAPWYRNGETNAYPTNLANDTTESKNEALTSAPKLIGCASCTRGCVTP